ncbi:hypothetical protein GPALN_010885 [Globodera pallida]|nr:hypothetical protein GPALN_010885 [Globodera pallida]
MKFFEISILIFLVGFQLREYKCQNGATTTTTPPTNATVGQIQIKVGLLFANGSQGMRTMFGFGQSAPAITLALNRAKQEHLVDSLNFTFSWLMCDCFQPWAVGYANQLILQQNVDAIIGPPCVSAALVAGYDATFYNIPMFLWGPTVSSDLTNDTLYPTVLNTNVNSRLLSIAVRAVLAKYNWSEVSFVYAPDNQRMVCPYFQADFETLINDDPNLSIVFKRKMDSSSDSMRAALMALANRSRIVVACFDNVDDRRKFLLSITDLGLDGTTNSEFVFIIGSLRGLGMMQPVGNNNKTAEYIPMWVQQNGLSNDGRDNDALLASRRIITVDLENQSNVQLDAFNRNMSAEFGKYPFYCAGQCMGGDGEQNPSNYARTLFDTTYAYLLALNNTMDSIGTNLDALRNGTLLISMTKSMTFQGQTGTVVIDAYGNRQPTFYATMLDGTDTPTATINITIVQQQQQQTNNTNGSAVPSSTTAFSTVTAIPLYTSDSALWVNYGGKQPLTTPRCGYAGNECPQDISVYIYSGGGLILLLILATVAAIGIAIRAKLRERARLTRECLIPFAELRNLKELRSYEELNSEASKSMRSMHSSVSGQQYQTDVGKQQKKLETESYAHFAYNREVVFGAKYPVKVRIGTEELGQLRKLRLVDNDNLNKFFGVCIDAPILYAIWKHCQRGSLKDLIAKEQYVGDTFVMVSLMRDLTNGLAALHQTFVGAHGMLSSENCLINDRWQVKISDFGLNMIRESQQMPRAKLLWTAPELLRQNNNRAGTVEGDVYSFSIICVELINRETVWNGTEREQDIDEILYRLKRSNVAIPYRPQIRPGDALRDQQSLVHLVRDCWAENAQERPKIERIRALLRQFNREGGSHSLMDYVFGMLEQYASSLEQEVEERTKELVEEKRKSDILLCRMLPKQVADKLKLGESVEPESFQMATVLFSDVVSFTTLASKCTPLQVVNLLNNLYTTFDNIIDTFDTYKVETIGDGYLVCSGIPKRNGEHHAREIAELAFAFLRAVANFRIDHLHAERVNLRIGFHTGPVVAGVVGLTMPRYCLFGDTVNTASRMESNGKSAQIHISDASNHFLTSLIGGYVTEPRGEGKGVMETFWLLGHAADGADGQFANGFLALF